LLFHTLLILLQALNIQHSDKPLKENALTFKKELTLIDEEEGFYKRVNVGISENETIALYDSGNKRVLLYNNTGKLLHQFGKEGKGPGEFSENTFGPYITNTRIYMRQWDKTMVFDYEGKLLKEHKLQRAFGVTRSINDKLVIFINQTKETKFLRVEFSDDGMSYTTIKNPKYDEKYTLQMQKEWYKRPLDRHKWPWLLLPFNENYYIQSYPGAYRVEVLDKDRNVVANIKREFKRIKEVPDYTWQEDMKKRASKSTSESYKKSVAAYINNFNSTRDGYEHDITDLFVLDDYIIVETSTGSHKSLAYDVYTKDYKYYTHVKLELEKEYISSKIINNKLILTHNDEEEGPYSSIYSVKIH